MLKTQLHSNKISRLEAKWQEIEDILTGDFFGVLDYLPREIFLKSFITYIASLNSDIQLRFDDDVDWENANILFWPHTYTDDENAEPDVVIVSNRWVIVIEVKLLSGLGYRQPWREYCIGRQIAENHALPQDSVFYLVLARSRLDISQKFKPKEAVLHKELAAKTLYLKWHQAVALIVSWLNAIGTGNTGEQGCFRMLSDLYRAVRKRKNIPIFSEFSFANTRSVNLYEGSIFCPPRFTGFVVDSLYMSPLDEYVFLNKTFKGFGDESPEVNTEHYPLFWPSWFSGFIKKAPYCKRNKFLFFKECDV